MTRRPRGRAALLILALASLQAARAAAEAPSLSWAPAAPEPGGAFTVSIVLPGVDARDLTVDAGRGAAGMEFVSATAIPVRGELPAARVELGYRVLAEGELSTGPITIKARSASWSFEAVRVLSLVQALVPAAAPAAWIAPGRVGRYEAFRIAATLPDGRAAVLEPFAVQGLSTFDAPDGSLVALALQGGRVALPRTLPALPGVEFRPAVIEVAEAPDAIRSSRAVGDFSLRLEPGRSKAVAGEAFSFTLVLEGSGSLPVVALPALSVEGPSGPVPVSDLALIRRDEFAPVPGGFEGRVLLDCVVLARDEGSYRARFAPFEFRSPEGTTRRLSVKLLALQAAPRVDPAALSEAYGRLERFLADDSGRSRAALRARKALAARAAGDEPGFVLALHDAERALGPFERGLGAALAAALDAREAALGLGPRPRDALPPPSAAFVPALAALAAALAGAFLAAARARREGRFGPRRRFRFPRWSSACLVLGLALSVAGAASLAERARGFALVLPGPVRAIPAEEGGTAFTLRAAVAGRVMARAGAWARVSFADGRSGWVADAAAPSYGGYR